MSAIRKRAGDFAAIIAMAVIALGVAGYILVNQDARPTFPLIEQPPLHLEAEFSDAQAVVAGQGQSVRVAGVEVGKVTDVYVDDGMAIVGMDINADFDGLIREDASALLRPRTGLKDMFVEVDPGTDETPALEENDRITVENTAPDVDPDEILSSLDTDTRAYLKLLISGAGKGLNNNGDRLREVFKRFEPLHRDLERVQGAFAARRQAMERLIHNYGLLTAELGKNDEELTRIVTASNEVFEAFASVDESVSASIARFPSALRQTESTLFKVEDLGRVLGPTLDSLRPAFRQLDVANRQILPLVNQGTPILREHIRPFVRKARPYVRDLEPAAEKLDKALPDLTTSFGELNRFFNMLAFNPARHQEGHQTNPSTGNEDTRAVKKKYRNGDPRDEGYLYWLGWVANNTVSLHSSSDAEGPVRRSQLSISCAGIEYLLGPVQRIVNQLPLPPGTSLPTPVVRGIISGIPILTPAQKEAANVLLDLAERCGKNLLVVGDPVGGASASGVSEEQGRGSQELQLPGADQLPDPDDLPNPEELLGQGGDASGELPPTGTEGTTGGDGE